MKKLITLSILVVFSCQTKTSEVQSGKQDPPTQKPTQQVAKTAYSPIYVTTMTTIEKNNKHVSTTYEAKLLNSDYFDIRLGLMGDHKSYTASKDIEPITDPDNYTAVSIFISNSKEEITYFKSSTDFLNFMSAGGYEMVDQLKNKYGADYTFKKK